MLTLGPLVAYGLLPWLGDGALTYQNITFMATRRASAIGMHNYVTGVINLPASLIAGALWLLKPASAFLLAAGLAFSAMCVFALTRPDRLRQGALPH